MVKHGASPRGDRAATASQPSPETVSGIAGIPLRGVIRVRLVCSNRQRAQTQNDHSKGHQFWVRDTHHATLKTEGQLYEGGAKTLCGRDCSEWLEIENNIPAADAVVNIDLCTRCAAKIQKLGGAQ